MSLPHDWRRAGYSIEQMRLLARQVLPRPVFDYADGGAETESTLRRNELAFGALALLPRPLQGAAERDLSVQLFGQRLALPLLIGPTGLAGLFWPDGEQAAARAAARAGTVYCLSHGSVCTLEALAAAADAFSAKGANTANSTDSASPRWMQVFVYKDRGFTRELCDRAAAAGYQALVLTIDNQLLGHRERDLRNGFGIPPRFSALDVLRMSRQLPWLWRMRHALPRLTFGNYVRPGAAEDMATLAGRMGALLDPAMNWDDVAELRARWKGPLLLKGVLDPGEALQAARLGVDGIIVSNHGGRQLDGAVSSIEALPAIVAALRPGFAQLPILLDGGIRRGADLAKALALGATAALIGRPQLWGLAVAGEDGVLHVLDTYRRELDRVMGLLGARSLAQIDSTRLLRLPPA
jgi:isopentenyl diphosphate isomerase/L-lactate dehydrogenase-like FMN-dependent dehydrogenase